MFEKIKKWLKKTIDKKNKQPKKIPRNKITDEFLENLMATNGKIYIDDFVNTAIIKELGLTTKFPVRMTLRGSYGKHAIDRHGGNSNLVLQSGKEPTSYDDIRNHTDVVNSADLYVVKQIDNLWHLFSIKALDKNHHIVVECISSKKNELTFKSYYKEQNLIALFDEDFLQDAKILTPDGRSCSLGALPSAGLDRPSHLNNNPTTKKQISQEQKKQAHLAREAGIKKSLDLLQKKQSKSADTAISNISSDSIKNETKPKFRKMLQRKDNINNKDKK